MAVPFNADEILKIAVEIERNGQAFYRRGAELVVEEELKKLFLELAEWEEQHERLFTEMRNKFARQNRDLSIFDPEGEAAKYLKAIADGKIFEVRAMADELSGMSEDSDNILKTALQREKDAVIFFTAMKEVVPADLGKDEVRRIIGEELGHIRFLSDKIKELKA